MIITAVIVAAGKSRRFRKGIKKQYISINKKPIIWHAVNVFEKHPLVNYIIIVVGNGYKKICERICEKFKKVHKVVYGGRLRQDSVFAGLRFCIKDTEIVLIHDAVRPFVTNDMITKLIQAAVKNKAVVPAISVNDTVKKNSKTIDRKNMFLVQTPQAFSYKLLFKAYTSAYKRKFYGTDDSTLIERIGCKVKIVKGSPLNIKITTYEDFLLAKAIYKSSVI